jgi:hypothetical protein
MCVAWGADRKDAVLHTILIPQFKWLDYTFFLCRQHEPTAGAWQLAASN